MLSLSFPAYSGYGTRSETRRKRGRSKENGHVVLEFSEIHTKVAAPRVTYVEARL